MLLLVVLHRSSRSAPPESSEDLGTYIRGVDLMRMTPQEVAEKYGYRVVHQSWKTERLPAGIISSCFRSWSTHSPQALHVLWTDSDNLQLVHDHYPEFLEMYNNFPMGIMRADMVRVLYLHRFGGLYVDMDYEAKSDFFSQLPPAEKKGKKYASLYAVESPVLMLGVMENSMMVGTVQKHPFFYTVVEKIAEITNLINHPETCSQYNWSGCLALIPMFHNVFLGKFFYLLHLLDITGPNVLTKTYVTYLHKHWDLQLLPKGDFHISGKITQHHQMNSWMGAAGKMWELFFLVGGTLVFSVGVGFFACYLLFKHRWKGFRQ